jgi:hypothetical protein
VTRSRWSRGTPFASAAALREGVRRGEQPRVLLVAPLSGHFATLLRGTVRTLLPEHDVYLTDWHNARDVPRRMRALRRRRVRRARDGVLADDRPGGARRGGLPAVRDRARGRRRHGGGGRSGAAAQHGPDGRPGRHARKPDNAVNELARSKPIAWFEQQPDRARSVAATAGPGAASTPASSNSPPS